MYAGPPVEALVILLVLAALLAVLWWASGGDAAGLLSFARGLGPSSPKPLGPVSPATAAATGGGEDYGCGAGCPCRAPPGCAPGRYEGGHEGHDHHDTVGEGMAEAARHDYDELLRDGGEWAEVALGRSARRAPGAHGGVCGGDSGEACGGDSGGACGGGSGEACGGACGGDSGGGACGGDSGGGACGGAVGGAPAGAAEGRRWWDHATWDSLARDGPAYAEYSRDRLRVRTHPNFDWGGVLEALAPKMREKREYIGLVVPGRADPRRLELLSCEADRTPARAAPGEFASISGALAERVARRPALFIYHTHPDDDACWPLPSSADLSAAIHLGAMRRYAAEVVVSRYGVIMYGLNDSAVSAIAVGDPRRAVRHLNHDVVVAHEAIRSWEPYVISQYLQFYGRHRLFILIWPSSAMVADTHRRFEWPLDATKVDYTLMRQVVRED